MPSPAHKAPPAPYQRSYTEILQRPDLPIPMLLEVLREDMAPEEYIFLMQTLQQKPDMVTVRRNWHLEMVKEATDSDPFVIQRRKHLEIVLCINYLKFLEIHAVY